MLKTYSIFSGFNLIGRVGAEDEQAALYLARILHPSYGKHIRVEEEA